MTRGRAAGGAAFASPWLRLGRAEQAHGRVDALGPRSDIYAVGAVLYRLVTGAAPYDNPNLFQLPYAVLELVCAGPPAPIAKLDPKAPVALVAICDKAMARHIEDRYESMRELSDELRAYLDNRVVRAYRTGALAEMCMWVPRNRGVAAALLILVLGTVCTATQYVRAVARGRELEQVADFQADRLAGLNAEQLGRALPAGLPVYEMGKPEEAEPLKRQAADRAVVVLGEDHPQMLVFKLALGRTLTR